MYLGRNKKKIIIAFINGYMTNNLYEQGIILQTHHIKTQISHTILEVLSTIK